MPQDAFHVSKTTLPAEIWGEIAQELNAFDVCSLSKTCKDIYSSLSGRDIWTLVLRAECLRQGIFPPTYPVVEMTLAEIRRAASRPERWNALRLRTCRPFAEWDSASSLLTSLQSHPSILPTVEGDFHPLRPWQMHLVPGGKFLVVLSLPHWGVSNAGTESTAIVLTLYDLGTPGCPTVCSPRPLLFQSFTVPCLMARAAVLSRSGIELLGNTRLRIVLVHPNGTTQLHSWTARVFDADLGGDVPSLRQHQSSLTVIAPRLRVFNLVIHKGRILMQFPRSVFIWHVEGSQCTSLRKPDMGTTLESQQQLYMLTSDYLISVGPDAVSLWETSSLEWARLQPVSQVDEASAKPVQPHAVLSNMWDRPLWDEVHFSRVVTHTPRHNGLVFDAHYKLGSEPGTTVRYELNIDPTATEMCPKESQIRITPTSAIRFPFPRFRTNVDLAHGHVCFLWGPRTPISGLPGAGTTYKVYSYLPHTPTSTVPGDLEKEGSETAFARLQVDVDGGFPKAFCQFSGRMILSYQAEGREMPNVKVVDYIS